MEHHFDLRPEARWIDLLLSDTYARYASRPALLREEWNGHLVIVDEIQKLPALLDEVHWLIEHRGAQFVLTGSSAHKLRRGHANLLGGRAWRYELGPLSCTETEGFELEAALISGLLPPHFLSPDPERDLRAYVADYLKEEVAGEARLQNLPAFADFLRVAALTSSELINYTNVARECGVSAKVVRGYFQILEDSMLGFRLPAWTRSEGRRMIRTEKFYLFDVGLANHLARRRPEPGSTAFGKAFEHFILMEAMNYRRYLRPELELRYWRSSTGQEVDLVLGEGREMRTAIEIKGSERVHAGDLRHLAALAQSHPGAQLLIVSLEGVARSTEQGIRVLPWPEFIEGLWGGKWG